MTSHQTSCARAIRAATFASAGAAAILSPLPLADEVLLAAVYAALALVLARIHEVPAAEVPWAALAATTLKGLAARGAATVTVALVPGVAAVANAASAAALTELIGRYFDASIAAPGERIAAPGFAM